MRRLLFVSLLICYYVLHSLSTSAQTAAVRSSSSKPKQAPQQAEKAIWNDQVQSAFGISREDFKAMGLSNLTPNEFALVWVWAKQRELQAEQKGFEAGKAGQLSYTCGPKFDEVSASKVSIIIEGGDTTPAELMSGIRQRIRNISDVQIIYDPKNADLIVSILGYEVKVGDRNAGYAASVLSVTPCTSKLGNDEWSFRMVENHVLETSGRDSAVLIEDIVTTIDSKDIERIREQHASWNSFFRQQKK